MGFYLKGDKPFFASLRFSIKNHGEIQTSKGTAALGTEFRAVVAPITVYNGILNFMNSIMATEDNTTVTVTDFQPNVQFSDFITRTQITFTLNKGQSYIIDGSGDYSQNFTGYIGAKIISDKPIVIANGNFNGQYAGNYDSSSDILMDQGVPVDKLGQEFVLMKGNGTTTSSMEKAIIVATEDNTEIYINNGTTPVVTLNAGQFYQTTNGAYQDQGFNHYNMLIKATKNIYVYQLMAGDSGSSMVATGGFNYIPPLNCYLPKKIDEIGKIDENEYSSNGVSYSLTVPTKLNIITERNALVDVKRNGISLALNTSNGPFDVTGNNAWVTYSIPNITGNVAVYSSKAVTAGISAGNDAVGYGGYFAGFSSIPLITKTVGDCLPGVKLEVTEGFDSYQWLIKVGATYVPAPGINNTFEYIPSQAGIYAVKVKQGSCDEIQTRDFKFYNCTTFTNYNYDTCTTKTVTPIFALSSQSVNIPTIKIDTPPTKGTVVINADGTITYTANPNATGVDTFKFSFCGTGTIPDCETVQATIQLNQIEHYDRTLNECSATATATYNLTLAALSPDVAVSKKYFTDAAFTNQIPTAQITNYTSAPGFVYVQLSNTYGCDATARIELLITAPPVVTPALYTLNTCDEEIDGVIDGIYKVNLTTITPIIVQNPTAFTSKYYATQAQAITGGTDLITGNFTFTTNTSVWIRVESPSVCGPIIKEVLLTTGTKLGITTPVPITVCDNDRNNTEPINLADYLSSFITNPYDSVKYFDDLTKAQNDLPGQNISAAQTITADKTFYYRFKKAGVCDNIGTLNISFKSSTPSTTLAASVTVCEGSTTDLNVGSGYSAVLWSTGETTTIINVGVGNYYVDLTNASGCIYRQNVSVVDSPKPKWNIAAYNATNCDDDFDGNIKVKFSNITPAILPNFALFTVEYSLFANFSTLLPNDWTYNANTTVYVRTISAFCPIEVKTIDFKIGAKISLIKTIHLDEECDTDFDGIKTVDLSVYISKFTIENGVTPTYFKTLADAQNNVGSIPSNVSITNSGTYYLRFHKNGICDNIATITIKIKVPKKSTILSDKNICPEAKITLDAGPGFSSYLWSNGSTAQTIIVPVGDYWVDLTFDGCIYRQVVSVKAVSLPIITGVEIQGGTVTVLVSGGKPPYQYSINGVDYQASNIFSNLPSGDYTIYVISADQCLPTTTEINILRILNVITPNDDGKNDILNYSDLLRKDNPSLQIFDRYGTSVFKGDKNNSFSWDGKTAGKTVATGSYWYVLQWQEPGSPTISKLTGWVLVKTRE